MYNCTLTENVADRGGAAQLARMYNCTVTANIAASHGGGGSACGHFNCIIYYNTAPGEPNWRANSMVINCCTTPEVAGQGNITNEPLFVDRLNENLRLQSNSPCINARANAYARGSTDLDGRPRIVGGTVDLGAYEVQDAITNRFVAWLNQHGLALDISSDGADPDGDGGSNWQEWVAGTDPTNALSALRLLPLGGSLSGVAVTWQSLTNRS